MQYLHKSSPRSDLLKIVDWLFRLSFSFIARLVFIDKRRIFTDKTTAMQDQICKEDILTAMTGVKEIWETHQLLPELLQDETALNELIAAIIAHAENNGPEQKIGRKVNLSETPNYIKEQIKQRLIEKGYPVRPCVDCSTWVGVTAGEYNNSKFVHTTTRLDVLRATCAGKAKTWDWATFYAML